VELLKFPQLKKQQAALDFRMLLLADQLLLLLTLEDGHTMHQVSLAIVVLPLIMQFF
jgi:hypothetical protein